MTIAGWLLLCIAVCGQTPDPDTLRDPVKQGDPEVRQNPADINYVQNMTKILPEDLPKAVRQTLQGPEYLGWEKATIYKNKAGDRFLIEIRNGDKVRYYRFDKEGKPVDE